MEEMYNRAVGHANALCHEDCYVYPHTDYPYYEAICKEFVFNPDCDWTEEQYEAKLTERYRYLTQHGE